jgi:hypothetical protein
MATPPGAPLAAAEPVPEPPKKKTPDEVLDEAPTLPVAFTAVSAYLTDSFDNDSVGTRLLGRWSAKHMAWADVGVAKDETSYAMVEKDTDAELGKRLCVTGRVVQIGVVRLDTSKESVGLFASWSDQLYRFFAVGSSGALVEDSTGRICGIVTGRYDYANSGGGAGHAVTIVGMFDLPENRKKQGVTAKAATPSL